MSAAQKKSMHAFTLSELAASLEFQYQGDGSKVITGLAPFDEPHPDAVGYIKQSSVDTSSIKGFGALIVPLSLQAELANFTGGNVIFAADPYALLLRLIPLFFPKAPLSSETSIHPTAVIDPSAIIGTGVSIGPWVVVGAGCTIGDNTVLHAHVTLYEHATIGSHTVLHAGVIIREGCKVGSHCTLQPHAVIGADGFGYAPDKILGLKAIPQVGITVLEDYVDVGACSTVDRATLGTTLIAKGSKLDNQVHVGHNTKIGSFSILCGQVGVAGSTVIEDQVVLGGGVGVADHIHIPKGIRVGAASQVPYTIKGAGDFLGNPAVPAMTYRRNVAELTKLHETIKTLKKQIKELQAKNA
jgi:UDP-3-O-[3-hydroxymyristoyl] glucosamine N-acyltransferase